MTEQDEGTYSCLETPPAVRRMMMFSVIMKGSSFMMLALMTLGKTTRPSVTFCRVMRMASASRNISGISMRRYNGCQLRWLENETDAKGRLIYAGRVVKRPLHPLGRVCVLVVGGLALEDTSETGNTLRTHRVLLVSLHSKDAHVSETTSRNNSDGI